MTALLDSPEVPGDSAVPLPAQVAEADSDPLTARPRREDGIVDPVAVAMAVRGTRKIWLTQRECRVAVVQLVASGMSPGEISDHLGVPLAVVSEQIAAVVSAAA